MKLCLLLLISLLCSSSAFSKDELLIEVANQKLNVDRAALLANPGLVTLNNFVLPGYPGKTFTLKAISLCTLLQDLPGSKASMAANTLKAVARDNYTSHFKLSRIYPCNIKRKSTAWIAIEETNKPWPVISKIKRSAGPFYLIWSGEKVSQTDWIFGLEKLILTDKNPFSSLLPANSNTLETLGFEVFSNKCGVCHSMNLIGNLQIGPDLNVPQNPTEYFTEAHLRQFIRNPQSVRYMKEDKMFAFTKEILSDQELDALIAFLKLMRTHKIRLN